jgi:hypothetical protein
MLEFYEKNEKFDFFGEKKRQKPVITHSQRSEDGNCKSMFIDVF